MSITTNNQQRPIIYWHDLPTSAQDEYEHLSETGSAFFKYKGWYYSFDEFFRCSDDGLLAGWDGYMSDSAFSGVAVKFSEGNDSVIVGTFIG